MVPIPPNEAERLAVLRSLRMVGSVPEPHFDAVCRIAMALFEVPTALISFVEEESQWFKARCGFDASGTSRQDAFCSYTILSNDVLVVEDALADPRFADNPLVTGPPHVRFYAGAPLTMGQGLHVGTLCVLDTRPRSFSVAQCDRLRDLAETLAAHLRLHDLTEARARETTVQQAAILGQLAEGVIVTDEGGRITLVNDAAATLHGVARLDVEPDAYSATYHLYTEEGTPYIPHELPLARAVRGETVRDARWRVRRPDGSEILAIGTAQPLRGSDGRQIGALLTMRDDTAREAAEHALRDLNATLAQRVAERTLEAEASRAHAESANRAKSDFLAAMSHEIRTPLNAIIGFTDLMVRSGRLAPDLQHQAQLVQMSGNALLTVVNDILDFSKAEAGAIELLREPFDPRRLIDNCVTIVRSDAVAKGLAITTIVDPALPRELLGDPARLRQILLNLLNNAVKFTGAGSVILTVSPDAGGPFGERLRFSITDTGIGIPYEKQSRLFERFSQVDNSIQRDFGGTGLGLAISRRLVALMGGEIGVVSQAGQGSTFWFTAELPLAPVSERPIAAIVSAPASRPGHLLLVEDMPINQEVACAVLRSAGHTVDVVANGEAAVQAVQTRAYDLVLMDVQMPGMDGMTATRLIRALHGKVAAVPIVAMTANVLPEQVDGFLAAGMNDHVAKPFNRAQLFTTIDRWLQDDKRPSDQRVQPGQAGRPALEAGAEWSIRTG